MHVYLIQNVENGKCYVGQHAGDDLDWYFLENVKSALRGNTGNRLLYRAIRKYGPKAFTIRSIYSPKDKEDMCNAEIAYIKFFGTQNTELGYNLTAGGEGILGFKFSEEQKEANRLRAIERGIPAGFREGGKKYLENRVFTEEYRQKLSRASKGKPKSKEHCEAMSIARKKLLADPEIRKRMCGKSLGKKLSEETKAKMRIAQAVRREREMEQNVQHTG